MRMSESSAPASSSHFTMSTMVRAGTPRSHGDPQAGVIERSFFGVRPVRQPAVGERLRQFDLDDGTGERALLNFARRADGDDAAFIDDGHAVAELLGLFDVVGGEQNGALLAAQIEDQFVNLEARLRIEAGRRFVEKQHLRIVEQGQGQREALLLSAGERDVVRPRAFPRAAGA